jgi:PhzF family phenazine biosynthesis protein
VADYRVRIFTLEREMPFAGHPTLGSCHAWLSNGGQPHNPAEVIQECGVGLVPVRPTQHRYAFAAPKLQRSGPLDESKIAEIAGFLRIERSEVVDAQWVDNGPGWAGVLLKSAEAVLALNPPKSSTTRIDYGVIGPYPPDSPQRFELRAFFSDQHGGILEDPVTGSLNASMAQWMIASGRAVAPYQASQGTRLDRAGRIDILQDASGQIWIGGRATTLFSGDCLL